MEVEIPQQAFRIPAIGIIAFSFDRLRCKDFVASSDTKNGFYLVQDHAGLAIKFSVFCQTKARQLNNGKRTKQRLLGSSINLNVTGSYFMTELGFNYDQEYNQIIPIIEKLESSFDQVDVVFISF